MHTYDPLDAQQQRNLFWNHPLVTKNYVALTPSMPQVLEVVMDSIALHKKALFLRRFLAWAKLRYANSWLVHWIVILPLRIDPLAWFPRIPMGS